MIGRKSGQHSRALGNRTGLCSDLLCLGRQETKQYSDKLNQIRSQMAKIDMPSWLETSIFDYYQYLYDRFNLVDATFESFLWELPDSVHVEVKWHMHGSLLRKVYLFQDCTEFFVMQACPSATVLRTKCAGSVPVDIAVCTQPLHETGCCRSQST